MAASRAAHARRRASEVHVPGVVHALETEPYHYDIYYQY